ncbi:MAG: hypothetical protein ACTTH7_07390 [Treponema sp.]
MKKIVLYGITTHIGVPLVTAINSLYMFKHIIKRKKPQEKLFHTMK